LIDKNIKEFFDLGHTTLYEWKKNKKGDGRKLLYEVLKSLPNDYIEGIKKKLEEEEKLKQSLKKN